MQWLVRHPALQALASAYGFFVLSIFVLLAILDGSFWRKPDEKDKKLLRGAQQKYWSLEDKPFGATHQFFQLRSGKRLHYIEKVPPGEPGKKRLTIFLHGFPDSWPVWRRQISSPLLSKDSILVAPDLPCYGGSDSFDDMGTPVLEAITEFILGMRQKYFGEEEPERVLIVTHDWGSVIGFRLAAEAPQLADRFIICSVFYPALLFVNIVRRVKTARKLCSDFISNGYKISYLRNALHTLAPLGTQLHRSGYIFAFNLPAPVTAWIGHMGDAWFLRLMHRLAFTGRSGPRKSYFPPITPAFSSEAMACSIGPGIEQCHGGSKGSLTYPESVARRTSDAGWESKLRIYRHGLSKFRWEKSLETLVALNALESTSSDILPSALPPKGVTNGSTSTRRRRSSSTPEGRPILDEGPKGALRAPATVVYGLRDPAFDRQMALDGLTDYMVKGSQVLIVEKAGHWVNLEEESAGVLERIIAGYLRGDEEGVKNVRALGEGVKVSVDF